VSATLYVGELQLEQDRVASSCTSDHATSAAGGSAVPPSLPPRFPRRRRGGDRGRPSRKEELLRQAAMFSAGFIIALLVAGLAGRRP
jgi:hypothetical protein